MEGELPARSLFPFALQIFLFQERELLQHLDRRREVFLRRLFLALAVDFFEQRRVPQLRGHSNRGDGADPGMAGALGLCLHISLLRLVSLSRGDHLVVVGREGSTAADWRPKSDLPALRASSSPEVARAHGARQLSEGAFDEALGVLGELAGAIHGFLGNLLGDDNGVVRVLLIGATVHRQVAHRRRKPATMLMLEEQHLLLNSRFTFIMPRC